MQQYVRVCQGLTDYGVLVKPEEVESTIRDYNKDYYTSVYYYNEKHYEQFKKTGSIKGITDVVTDKLALDFDSKDNLDTARQDALRAVKRLQICGIKEENIEIYFSGSKGFTVLCTLPRLLTPEEHGFIALNRIGEGLKTADSTLYNASRILRVPGTKHQDTGLYKIPLTFGELNTLKIEQIKELAKESFIASPAPICNPLEALFDVPVPEPKKIEKVNLKPDLNKKPLQWKDYKAALLDGYFESGERHQALLVVAATCRGLGYSRDHALAICKTTAQLQADRTNTEPFDSDEIEENIIDASVYSDSWRGGTFSYENNAWLQQYCKKMGFKVEKEEDYKIYNLSDLEHSYTDYIKNIEANTILTGIRQLDEAMPLTVGMNLGVVGAASSGKTALALEILENTSRSGVLSVFASLDMHKNRLFEKVLYRVTGMSRTELYDAFRNGRGKELTALVKERYANVYFYDRSCPTVDDIKTYIQKVEAETGRKVKLLMVDYFERVNSERSDETAASKDVAGQLQDIINDLNICLITLVQPNKFSLSGGPDSPITSYTAIKGSSFLYQSFRSILSIWRPFFNPEMAKENDRFLQMAILKNDLGELDMFNFSWNGKTGSIKELTEEELSELNDLLAAKHQKKEAEQSDNW